jgi:FAD/FMN-containing dehydrogenase
VGRRFGLALDNVLEVDIITADGKFRRANKDENPDLYWGVRGGGGNFGVVTSFKFRLHPMQRQVVRASFRFPGSDAKNVMDFFGEYANDARDDMYVSGGIAARPNGFGVSISVLYSGPLDQADALLAPIRKAGKVTAEDVRTLDYVLVQKMGDNQDIRSVAASKSGFVGLVTPQLVDALIGGMEPHPERSHSVAFQQSGGIINRVAPDATAFPHRDSNHNMLCGVRWDISQGTEGAEHRAYVENFWKEIEPYTQGFYTNDMLKESQGTVNLNYLGNYRRLVEIKNKYDPSNLFRRNANVPPSV